MKKLFALWMVILITFSVYAQAPQKMSYQCVVRNASGVLVANQSVGIRITILQGTSTGTVVYAETQTPATNANGLVSIEIGGGTGFDAINWVNGPYFLKTETDPTGGTNYTIAGTSKLLSVPYAMYSETAGNTFSGNYNDLTNKPALFDGTWSSITSKPATLSGYGISDGMNTAHVANGITSAMIANWNTAFSWGNHTGLYRPISYVPIWSEITSKPTTISGYGITDAVNTTDNQTITGITTFTNDLIINQITVGEGNGSGSGYSTAIGSGALAHNTTGHHNTAVGGAGLYFNTSGQNNTAIGNNALEYNEDGASNTAVGMYSLYHNNGSRNTAVGVDALVSNNLGNCNVAVGGGALSFSRSGNNNTAIGFATNVVSSDLMNTTAIGYGARVNANNTFVFGNNEVIGWGFGVNPGDAAIRVGSSSSNGNGAILTLTGVWTDASDISKKYDVKDISYGLNEVIKLRPVTYKLKGSNNQDIGFIAQEVIKIIPEIVYGEEGQMTMSYGQMTSVLVKAIQEQQRQIEELKAIVNNLIANQTAQGNK